MKNLDGTGLKRLHRSWRRETNGRIALVLDSVQTPYNVGAILRSAVGFGVEHVWLAAATESPHHPKTRKTSLGTEKQVPWSMAETIDEALDEVRGEGYALVGVELSDGASPLFELDLRGDVCLVVGHEDRGLSRTALTACDAVGYLPQTGRIGSLNVAHATTAALYEVRRQEWAG